MRMFLCMPNPLQLALHHVQMEQERLGKGQLTEEERARAAADTAIRDAAALKRLEQSDEARRMNQMMLRSQCMAIRCSLKTFTYQCIAGLSDTSTHPHSHWLSWVS